MVYLGFFVIFIAVLHTEAYQQKDKMKKVDCYSDPTLCINPVCEMTSLRKFISRRTYGCTPVTTIDKLKIRIVQFKKTYTNHFRPGFFDVTQDFCDILGKAAQSTTFFRTLFTNVYPGVFEQMEKNFQPCPFKDPWFVEIIQNETIVPLPSIIPSGEYKTMFRLFNEKNQTFYEHNSYYELKNDIIG